MVALVETVAYLGLEARRVEVQCQLAPGIPRFAVVGLPDKAVGESRERVQSALASMGLALPPKRITINLSPADLPKEGSHYDLPIALALLAAMGVTDAEQLADFVAVGELALDGRIVASPGVLLAALHASEAEKGLICPAAHELGEHLRVIVLSTTEGDDKPGKYPRAFRTSQVVVINKMDLLPYVPFCVERAEADARLVRPDLQFFHVSALRDENIAAWCEFLCRRREQALAATSAATACRP